MSDKKVTESPMLLTGLGIGLGAAAVWAAVELLPLLIVGGGAWLVFKSVKSENKVCGD